MNHFFREKSRKESKCHSNINWCRYGISLELFFYSPFYYLQLNIPPPHSGTGSSKSEKDLLLFLRPFLANRESVSTDKWTEENSRFLSSSGQNTAFKTPYCRERMSRRKSFCRKVRHFRSFVVCREWKGKCYRWKLAHFPPAALRRLNPAGHSGKRQFLRARFYRSTKIRFSLILPLRESCWGVPSPNPAYAACAA